MFQSCEPGGLDSVVRAAKKSPRHHVRNNAMILLAHRARDVGIQK
jgi:hypothetical protein